jgi:hypothetical protein
MKALKDRQGVVSVFLGTFPSREEFETYLEETYDEDRSEIGATCPFWTDLGVDWLDHDFQDAHYEGDVPVTLDVFFADPFSYLDSFRTDLLEACARQGIDKVNAGIFVYDYTHRNDRPFPSPHLRFVGSFTYVLSYSASLRDILNS